MSRSRRSSGSRLRRDHGASYAQRLLNDEYEDDKNASSSSSSSSSILEGLFDRWRSEALDEWRTGLDSEGHPIPLSTHGMECRATGILYEGGIQELRDHHPEEFVRLYGDNINHFYRRVPLLTKSHLQMEAASLAEDALRGGRGPVPGRPDLELFTITPPSQMEHPIIYVAPIKIGRICPLGMEIPDQTISRRHAEIDWVVPEGGTQASYCLRDMGSMSGTFLHLERGCDVFRGLMFKCGDSEFMVTQADQDACKLLCYEGPFKGREMEVLLPNNN